MADLRAGSLPVGVSVCLSGVTTYDDVYKSILVIQDGTGGFRFGNVNVEDDLAGRRVEICGETRQGTGGMALASVQVKPLGPAEFPKPIAISTRDWARGATDWKWVEIQGLAYAENTDWLYHVSLHVMSDGRRVRVYLMGHGAAPPAFAALMGAKVRVQGVARPAGTWGQDDLVLFCPSRQLIGVETSAPPGGSLQIGRASCRERV